MYAMHPIDVRPSAVAAIHDDPRSRIVPENVPCDAPPLGTQAPITQGERTERASNVVERHSWLVGEPTVEGVADKVDGRASLDQAVCEGCVGAVHRSSFVKPPGYQHPRTAEVRRLIDLFRETFLHGQFDASNDGINLVCELNRETSVAGRMPGPLPTLTRTVVSAIRSCAGRWLS